MQEPPNQAPWRCADEIQFLFYPPKMATSGRVLPSDAPIFQSTGPNLEFSRIEADDSR